MDFGNPVSFCPCLPRTAVHPHMRGGNLPKTWCAAPDFFGSSPHAWGQRCLTFTTNTMFFGSSPHAWGQRLRHLDPLRSLCRFIPTCVGAADRLDGDRLLSIRFIPTCVGAAWRRRTVRHAHHRFIPTCVGAAISAGSSCNQSVRFIPTCVGAADHPCKAYGVY